MILLLLATTQIYATVRTVDNKSNSAAQDTSLQTAIDSSSAGDTIYVSGSPQDYGNITLNKRLNLIGTGYNPNKDIPLIATIKNLILDSIVGVSGCSGSIITGFKIWDSANIFGAYIQSSPTLTALSNFTLKRNYIIGVIYLNSGISNNNVLIAENLIQNCGNCPTQLINVSGLVFQNNIIESPGFGLDLTGSINAVINNNIFIGTNSAVNTVGVDQCVFSNNIFYTVYPNATNSTFNNNLIFNTVSDLLPYGSNNGTGNYNGLDPLFVNVPNLLIDLTYDFQLQISSPGHNGGTDGTDIGPFGGITPLKDISGMPTIPQMMQMNITNPVIAPAGTLNVTFKAKKNN